MLNAISWSEFLIAIMLLLGIYYTATAIIYYRTEIGDLLKGRTKLKQIKPADELSEDVMGSARFIDQHVPREERIATEDIEVVSKEHDTEQPDADSLLVGTVSDLLEEIRKLNDRIVSDRKENLIPVFRELLSNYPQLINTQYQEAINLFLMNTCQEHSNWELELHEAESLWTSNKS